MPCLPLRGHMLAKELAPCSTEGWEKNVPKISQTVSPSWSVNVSNTFWVINTTALSNCISTCLRAILFLSHYAMYGKSYSYINCMHDILLSKIRSLNFFCGKNTTV